MVRTRIDPEAGQDTASSLDQAAVPSSNPHSHPERSESKSGLLSVRVLAAHLHWLCAHPRGQMCPQAPQLFVSVAPLRHLPTQTMLGS
jgi:hypothetical protein